MWSEYSGADIMWAEYLGVDNKLLLEEVEVFKQVPIVNNLNPKDVERFEFRESVE